MSGIRSKLAYIFMLIGMFLFLIGIVNLSIKFLNLHQSEYDSYLGKKSQLHKQQHQQSITYRKWIFKDNWYPNVQKNYKFYDFQKNYLFLNSSDSSLFIWHCKQKLKSDEKTELIMINLKQNGDVNYYSSKFTDFLNYIICSNENVYIFLLIILCIFGLITLVYGCLTFYKYNIKLNEPMKAVIIDNNLYETIKIEKSKRNCFERFSRFYKCKKDKKFLKEISDEEISENSSEQIPFIYNAIPKFKAYNLKTSPTCHDYSRKLSGTSSPCYSTANKRQQFFVRINDTLMNENYCREYFV
jgi:hypothetical protein